MAVTATRTMLLGLALVLASAGRPHAAPWLKLDRAEAESSYFGDLARLRIYVTPVELTGSWLPIKPSGATNRRSPWTVRVGSKALRQKPIVGKFSAAHDRVAIVFVIQANADYIRALPAVVEGARTLLDKLPSTTTVGVVSFADEIEATRRLKKQKLARGILEDLEAEPLPTPPVLVDALQRALKLLRRVPTKSHPVRKMIIVISDGRDLDMDNDNFRDIARIADRKRVRIHAIAHSPTDYRPPMLSLGELTEKTHGTFRLARELESFGPAFESLTTEVRSQYVLTYFVPANRIAGKPVQVIAGGMTSNRVRIVGPKCGDNACPTSQFCAKRGLCVARGHRESRGLLGWIVWIAGGALALLVIASGVGYLLVRRERPRNAQVTNPHVHAATGRATPSASGQQGILEIINGPARGRRFPLHHGFIIGSDRSAQLALEGDTDVAPQHAQIAVDKGGGFLVMDLHTPTGTYANGVRVTEIRLSSGMTIQIGATQFRFLQ